MNAFVGSRQDLLARSRRRRAVVHPRGDDAQRARNERAGTRADDAVPCHIIHVAMAPCGEPIEQPPFRDVEVGVRDADILESQRLAPTADVRRRARSSRARPEVREGLRDAWTWRKRTGLRRQPDVHRQPFIFPIAAATEAAGARLAQALDGRHDRDAVGRPRRRQDDAGRADALRALGWTGPVKSPSYPLVEHYPLSSIYFYHFDFYRFADPSEWDTAGLADCFHPGAVCLIEWPERVAGRLPLPDLALTLTYPADPSALRAGTRAGRRKRRRGERCLAAIISVDCRQASSHA